MGRHAYILVGNFGKVTDGFARKGRVMVRVSVVGAKGRMGSHVVDAVNGAQDFLAGFWQLLVILSVMNLIDRFWVDGYWVGHTNAWEIPGTEDLKPYITAKDKGKKWLFGTVGMAVISAALAAIMMLFMKI